MALALNQKIQRILNFLVAARQPEIFVFLEKRGFTQEQLDEGWRLFNTAAGARLTFRDESRHATGSSSGRELLLALDAWENTWLPVIRASLERHMPALAVKVLEGIRPTSGIEVVVSVGTLLERLDAAGSGPDGEKALALLDSRGLTQAVRDQARCWIQKLQTIGTLDLPVIDQTTVEERDRAFAEVWTWYREWSQIARTVITRGVLLVRLGLRQQNRAAAEVVGEPAAGELGVSEAMD
jgi:hypothetical protein